jgi:hypothetical protein
LLKIRLFSLDATLFNNQVTQPTQPILKKQIYVFVSGGRVSSKTLFVSLFVRLDVKRV